MSKVKKTIKVIGKIILFLLVILILTTIVIFIVHRIKLSDEEDFMTDEGYMNLISVGDYSLNVCSYGSDDPRHTIVGLSGMGVNDYSLGLRNVTDKLADENKIVIVERAGYGMSDDTTVDQTAEQIVSDYRTALKNADIKAPYVLMPHSIGSFYATYWESKYPD